MNVILIVVATAVLTVLVVLAVSEFVRLFRLLYERGGRLRGWFSTEARWFDRRGAILLLGVVLPITCFVFDPRVFRTWDSWSGKAMLEEYRPFFYAYVAIGSLAFLWWRPAGPWLRGVHRACACAALILGVWMLPLALLGVVVFGLGLLGLAPLVVAVLHWRVASRAARGHADWSWYRVFMGTTGFMFPSVLALTFHILTVDAALRRSDRLADLSVPATAEDARVLRLLLEVAPRRTADVFLVREYRLWGKEENRPAIAELDARYQSVTGMTLEDRRMD